LEFLHRVIDILEEFLGAPILSSKIEANYDVVAQLLNEMCDAGAVTTTEGNALRDLVEVEGWIGKLLGGINIPGFGSFSPSAVEMLTAACRKPGFTSSNPVTTLTTMPGISSLGLSASNTPALPWRRANVRHTSNELYVDLVETLSVILAPSGRPIAAFANGTIAFTSKISGVPDLLLTLSSPSGRQNIESMMDLPVFHPCVRLARWRERPGELSFIPPDGRFILAGYEVDLLPFASGKLSNISANLKLPVNVEVKTSLGPSGADFEVRVFLTMVTGPGNSSTSGSSGRPGNRIGGVTAGFGNVSSSSSPALDDLVITVPIPADVKNLSEIRASRGDTTYNPGDNTLEWSIPSKETSAGNAVLRCTAVGASQDDDGDDGNGFSFNGNTKGYDYNENESESGSAYQSIGTSSKPATTGDIKVERDERLVEKNKTLMPNSARISFAVKGWLASGIRVENLTLDTRKSRGIGEGMKPYKGVKYLSVSHGGVEVRCW
jgi:AP-3 complex subunit mu